MDNLCHTLVGAALGKAGLQKRTPLATAALLIGANLPDVDVLAYACCRKAFVSPEAGSPLALATIAATRRALPALDQGLQGDPVAPVVRLVPVGDEADARALLVAEQAEGVRHDLRRRVIEHQIGDERRVLKNCCNPGCHRVNRIMEARKLLPNASYFAFTATPKNKTLEIFGRPLPPVDGRPHPPAEAERVADHRERRIVPVEMSPGRIWPPGKPAFIGTNGDDVMAAGHADLQPERRAHPGDGAQGAAPGWIGGPECRSLQGSRQARAAVPAPGVTGCDAIECR